MRNSERPITLVSGNFRAHHSTIRETLSDHLRVFVTLYATISWGQGRTKLNISRHLRRFLPASKKLAPPPGFRLRLRNMNPKAMTVAGIMSGTSADGIDIALVRIASRKQRVKLTLLAHESFSFPATLRRAVLQAMN